MNKALYLGIDVGGTKIAWGVFDEEGQLLSHKKIATPPDKLEFMKKIVGIIEKENPQAVGVGIPGTISANHMDTIVVPHIPTLGHFELVEFIEQSCKIPVTLDNDARCALIGEVWQGCAQNMTSAVLLTLGTGVGGAAMQKGKILPHPEDINLELSRLVIDPDDMFPAESGQGTLEALLGGRNLERRYDIDLGETALNAKKGDKESIEIWSEIANNFLLSIKMIVGTYSCRNIIIGGKGSKDLDLYLQSEPPCPVLTADLGELAGVYGAARLAMDLHTELIEDSKAEEEWE